MKFFRNVAARKLQLVADKIDSYVDVGQAAGVGDDCLNGNIVREDFVVRVENRSALGENWLLNDVLFSREWLDRPEWPGPQRNREYDLRPITGKPLEPSENERKMNPRSRSAKLRVAEKIA